MNQRWRDRYSTFRSDTIRTSEYDVIEITDDTTARAFIQAHHYSGSYPSARFRFGLYRKAELAGVAVFSHPCNDRVLTSVFPGDVRASVELGRFVLLDEVPGNGETWFLARCFEQLRKRSITGIISFSDPLPRENEHGELSFIGHIGTIYQAHNAVYLGRGTPRTLRILPDGRTLSDRAIQKIRSGEKGWRYAASILERAGAAPIQTDRTTWLREAIARITRTIRHPGNHKYAWALTKSNRCYLIQAACYPKHTDFSQRALITA